VRFRIVAEASAGLLCRILGFFAQQDTVAPDMVVSVTAETMEIVIDLDHLPYERGTIVAEKIARCIGVETVALS
jgi:hypothetical protein